MKWLRDPSNPRTSEAQTASSLQAPRLESDKVKQPTLPSEVQALIVQNLQSTTHRVELKALRLSNRLFCLLATPILFEHVHYSISHFSLDRLEQVAKHGYLAQHVRRLVIHRGLWEAYNREFVNSRRTQALGYAYRLSIKHEKIWKLHDRGRLLPTSNCPVNVLDAFDHNLRVEVHSQISLSNGNLWLVYLQTLLDKDSFPNLCEFNLADFRNDVHSDYHARKIGRVQIFDTDKHPFSRCNNVSVLPILRINFRSIQFKTLILHNVGIVALRWFTLDSFQISFSQNFGCLKKLDLKVAFHQLHVNAYGNIQRTTEGLLRLVTASALSLEELSLELGVNQRPHQNLAFRQELYHQICQEKFPSLRHLTLFYLVSDEQQFLKFLADHSNTLESLTISHWTMPLPPPKSDTDIKRYTSSFVRAIWRIQQLTNLKHAQLDGFFYTPNDRLQVHSNNRCIKATKSRDRGSDHKVNPSVLDLIEAYLAHQAPFPFSDQVLEILEMDMRGLEIRWPTDGELSPLPAWLEITLDLHPAMRDQYDRSWESVIRPARSMIHGDSATAAATLYD